MKYASFFKRLKAYLIDYVIISIPLCIIVSFLMWKFFNSYIDGQEYPFILLSLIYFPHWFFICLIKYHEPSDILTAAISILLITLIEGLMYTIMEIFNNNSTIGKTRLKIKIVNEYNNKYSISAKISRNILKSLSRNLFFIPFLLQLITSKRQTLYDLIIETMVIENKI